MPQVEQSVDCYDDNLLFNSDTISTGAQWSVGYHAANYYVDEASQSGNGNSWEDAFKQLQPAVNFANNGDTIFIAKGTYYPRAFARDCSDCLDNRKHTIHPHSEVTILGGFPSDGGDLVSRDWISNPTIISGHKEEDPMLKKYHIVYIDSTTTGVRMDGLQFFHGLANGAEEMDKNGSALYCLGQVFLDNILISENTADSSILYIKGTNAHATINNTMGLNNSTNGLLLDVSGGAKLKMNNNTSLE